MCTKGTLFILDGEERKAFTCLYHLDFQNFILSETLQSESKILTPISCEFPSQAVSWVQQQF